MKGKLNRNLVISVVIFCVLISGCILNPNSEKATLQFTSSPSGAEIYLDNQYYGSTPSAITNVEFGNHTLEIRHGGYQSWSTSITVSSGTSHFYAALTPQPTDQQALGKTTPSIPSQTGVTVRASKDTMIVGDSMLFSGTGAPSTSLLLTLYGPGYYAKGVLLDKPKTNSAGSWSYTWNPGSSVQSGSYTIVVSDAQNIASEREEFSVVGGGEVSISASTRSIIPGDSVIFSGRCTTGAQNVLLKLYGPDRFSSGVELGSVSVLADKTWSFKYTSDRAHQAGIYTMYVYDVPQTASGSVQITLWGTYGE
ncbi:MAG: PEGA domain-containing protein [Methanoregula sp.]|jgi:hypothetical protein|nr:PEGA domain-containing protein [Methanoregula sp.]